jgi:hypothetical protein
MDAENNFNLLEEDDDLVDDFYNQIVRRRNIARRTNLRHHSFSLSQREVALAATIQSSTSFFITLAFAIMITMNQITTAIIFSRRRLGGPDSPYTGRLLRVLIYYQCLLTFCFHEIDALVQEDDALLNIRYGQLFPLENSPPKNRSIDELSEEFSYSFTCFTKDQLRLLFLHLRIPGLVITQHWHHFTGEEILIICLARLATGDPWARLIPGNFGGDVRRWSYAFRWFIEHIFINFYHKISGSSIERWIPEILSFKQAISDRLAQPAYPIEIE